MHPSDKTDPRYLRQGKARLPAAYTEKVDAYGRRKQDVFMGWAVPGRSIIKDKDKALAVCRKMNELIFKADIKKAQKKAKSYAR